MRKAYITTLLATIVALSSCSKYGNPTYDGVLYDESEYPVIVAQPLPETMMAEQIFEWGVEISAFNGIETILFNDEVAFTYGNGQFTHNASFTITMPDDDSVGSVEVNLTVIDELGNTTTLYPTAQVITILGAVPTSSQIFNPTGEGSVVTNTDEKPVFDIMASGYTTNCGWYSMPVSSDVESMSVLLYGAPYMSNAANSVMWPYYVSSDDEKITLNYYYTADGGASYKAITTNKALLNKLYLGNPIDEDLVNAVVGSEGTGGSRFFTVEIYVDTQNTTNGEACNYTSEHSLVALGLANTAIFCNTSGSRSGQTFGMTATIPATDSWQKLTFEYNSNNFTHQGSTMVDGGVPSYDNIDMLTFYVSPLQSTSLTAISNATYHIKNLKIEKIE